MEYLTSGYRVKRKHTVHQSNADKTLFKSFSYFWGVAVLCFWAKYAMICKIWARILRISLCSRAVNLN